MFLIMVLSYYFLSVLNNYPLVFAAYTLSGEVVCF